MIKIMSYQKDLVEQLFRLKLNFSDHEPLVLQFIRGEGRRYDPHGLASEWTS